MAEIAKFVKDNGGTLTTGGTSTAYTLTNNGSFTSLADGLVLAITANAACGASPTLNANGLGAKKLRKFTPAGEVDLAAGDLVANCHYALEYDSAANGGSGAWIVTNLDSRISAFGSTLVDDADAATARATLGILPTPVGIYDPSGVSALDLAFPSGKTVMRISGVILTSVTAAAISGRFSTDGTTFASGVSDYGYSQLTNNGATVSAASATAAQFPLAVGTDSLSVPIPIDLVVTAGASGLAATVLARSGHYNTTNDMRNSFLAGRRGSGGLQSHFRLFTSAGTFAAGSHLLVEAF
jgi:hypothetical protein